ncbi:hypothetical protein A2716_01395 [candidate division WWE3 bacterium RIFCSPHIGHO2_01_FULL_40_23]|uniref:Uncharacterized protein n=1 Tax=candidate division WWE3 bacterium RIFCSPLOWO2_01_FULL_41_18 TaxID=1802625 RepID=A0A1F4VE17_UNCKA|nr:MAG: hypothetical protein A2716_01395 [candidate division WWE3 bacterium RIFCSPHIGHO2_01_FULL_40_23]OGC55385.1 MAG: hypothetical protein A3A78_00300 [candidate division WWE3 bacterium RIFCSPLOWO2_01_FULL_41_18]
MVTKAISYTLTLRWATPLLKSVCWDAVASLIYILIEPRFQNVPWWIRAALWVPTGFWFVEALRKGLAVSVGYALFGVGVTFTNGIAGLFLGQYPNDLWKLTIAVLCGLSAIAIGAKARTEEDQVPNGWEWAVSYAPVAVIIGAIEGGYGFTKLALLGFPLADSGGSSLSLLLEGIGLHLTKQRYKKVVEIIAWSLAFAPASYLFSVILQEQQILLNTAVIGGILSAIFAPFFERMVYKSRPNLVYSLLTVTLGVVSIYLLTSSY